MSRSIIFPAGIIIEPGNEVQFYLRRTRQSVSEMLAFTAQTPGTPRNNYASPVGFKFTVGSTPITVTQLGVWVYSGNVNTHVIGLYPGACGAALGTVTVNMSGATAGDYLWGVLGTPIALSASTTYGVAATFSDLSDNWSENNCSVTPSADINSVMQGTDPVSGWGNVGGSNITYGLPNFKYTY